MCKLGNSQIKNDMIKTSKNGNSLQGILEICWSSPFFPGLMLNSTCSDLVTSWNIFFGTDFTWLISIPFDIFFLSFEKEHLDATKLAVAQNLWSKTAWVKSTIVNWIKSQGGNK